MLQNNAKNINVLRNLFFLVSFLTCFATVAQGGNWNVVWQEDFGVVEDSIIRDFADPNMSVPGHRLADRDHMADGFYGITNSTAWCFIRKKSINPNEAYHFVPGRDHTGNQNGGMLVVNVGGNGMGESIYENNLKLNVCGNHKYRLNMYVANVSDAPLSPNLTLQVYNMNAEPDGTLLESVNLSGRDVVAWPAREKNSSGLYTHKEREWSQASLEFEATEGDVLKIVIKNNCSSGNGNDFGLDDIVLERFDDEEIIQPQIDVDNELSKQACMPTYSVNNLTLLDAWKKLYDKVYFLWQFSTDNGYTWTNILEESGIEKTALHRNVPDAGSEVYRLIITGAASAAEAQAKAETIALNGTPADGCDYFSISNIISQVEAVKTPVAFAGIDGDKDKTEQLPYNCDENVHLVSLVAPEWEARFPLYHFLWQYSYDETEWTDLDITDKEFAFTDEYDGKTYFRAILAASDEVLAQVAANGKPDNDCDKEYLVTNTVAMECLESCKNPVFESSLQKQTICEDRVEPVVWTVTQTNVTKMADASWYVKHEGETEWTQIAGETDQTLSVANPKVSTEYLFLATNGKCVSDSLKFKLTVVPAITLVPLADVEVCEGADAEFSANVLAGTPTAFIWNNVSSANDAYTVTNAEDDVTVSLVAANEFCTSPSVSAQVKVEKKASVKVQPIPSMVCEGGTVDLIATATLSSANTFKWEKGGDLFSDADLVTADVVTADATYKFSVSGKKCPTIDTILRVSVEKKAQITLAINETSVCENAEVTLTATATNAPKLVWMQKGEGENQFTQLTFVGEVMTIAATKSAAFKVLSADEQVCESVESNEVALAVEDSIRFSLNPLPEAVCPGESVSLSMVLATGIPTDYIWTANGRDISSSANPFTHLPNTETKYALSVYGRKCPSVTKSATVFAIEPYTLQLNADAVVCEESTPELSVVSPVEYTIVWEKADDGLNFQEYEPEGAGAGLTRATSYRVKSRMADFCTYVYSNVATVGIEKKARVELNDLPTIVCEGDPVSLTPSVNASAANRYAWYKNGNFLSDGLLLSDVADGATAATYKFVVTGDKCPTVEDEFTVRVEAMPSVRISASSLSACSGDTITLNVEVENAPAVKWMRMTSESTNFEPWNGMTSLTEKVEADVRSMVKAVTSGLQVCPNAESEILSLFVEQRLTLSVDSIPSVVCEGDMVHLNATLYPCNCGSFGWKKNGEDMAFEQLTAEDVPGSLSTYEFWVDNGLCPPLSVRKDVMVELVRNVDLVASDTRVCKGSALSLTTSYPNAEHVKWEVKGANDVYYRPLESSTSQVEVSPLETSTYRVYAISENGCRLPGMDVTIDVDEPIGLHISDVEICQGDSVHLDARADRPFETVEWRFEGDEAVSDHELAGVDLSPKTTTTYTLIAFKGACVDEKIGTITVIDIPHILSHDDLGDHSYQMVTESADDLLYFDFHNGMGKTPSPVINNTLYGKTYSVDVSNTHGCASTYQFTVPVFDLHFRKYFYQGDENWKVVNLDRYGNAVLSIYDRFGKLIFEERGTTEGWDGVYNGNPMPSTDYWYVLDVPELDKQYTGHFTLLRK